MRSLAMRVLVILQDKHVKEALEFSLKLDGLWDICFARQHGFVSAVFMAGVFLVLAHD